MRERYQDVDGRPDLGISGRGAHPAWHRDATVKRLTDPRSFGTRYSDAPLVPGGYPFWVSCTYRGIPNYFYGLD